MGHRMALAVLVALVSFLILLIAPVQSESLEQGKLHEKTPILFPLVDLHKSVLVRLKGVTLSTSAVLNQLGIGPKDEFSQTSDATAHQTHRWPVSC